MGKAGGVDLPEEKESFGYRYGDPSEIKTSTGFERVSNEELSTFASTAQLAAHIVNLSKGSFHIRNLAGVILERERRKCL